MFKRMQQTSLLLLGISTFLPVAGYAVCDTAAPATTSLTDNRDGTVSDNKTGLIWKKCSEGQRWDGTGNTCAGTPPTFNWKDALEQVDTVNSDGFAGQRDWRLPNIKELASIIEKQCVNPAINTSLFPITVFVDDGVTSTLDWWSSSPNTIDGAAYPNLAWAASFSTGGTFSATRSLLYNVRLVRGE